MTERGSELLTAELVAQNESLVYRVGDKVWKIYPGYPIEKLRRYQRLTDAVAKELRGQQIEFETSNGRFTFQWQVTPIETVVLPTDDLQIPSSPFLLALEEIQNPDAPILRVRYPYTVSPYIPGPTMEDIFQNESSKRSNVFNITLYYLSEELNHRLGLMCIGLEEINIKPVSGSILNITDVCGCVVIAERLP